MQEELDQNSVQNEIAPQETAQQHVQDSAHTSQKQDLEQESAQERNWRQTRQRMKEQEAMLRAQQEVIDRLTKQSPQQASPTETFSDSDYLNAGKTKEVIQAEAKRIAEAQVNQILQERERANFHQRLKTKFNDFDEVVNADSLALLEEEDPELAQSISSVSDPYQAGLMVYKHLRNNPMLEKLPNRKRRKETEQKLKKNENIVPSPAQYEQRPMAQAFNMGSEDSSKLFEEMMKYAGQTSGY